MSKRSSGSVLWKVLISLALVMVLLAIVAEFGMRWYISDNMKKDFAANSGGSGEDASIKFGPTPLLASLITKNVPSVNITTPSTISITQGNPPTVAGTPASQLEIRDLNISDIDNPIAGHLVVNSQLPDGFMLAQLQASMADQSQEAGNDIASQLVSNLVKITGLKANSETGNLEVEFTDGAARLNLRPYAEGGKVHFKADSAELFGFKLPKQAADSIADQLEKQAADAGGNLSVDKFDVGDGTLNVTFSGDNVPLQDVEGSGGPASNATSDAVRGDRA